MRVVISFYQYARSYQFAQVLELMLKMNKKNSFLRLYEIIKTWRSSRARAYWVDNDLRCQKNLFF